MKFDLKTALSNLGGSVKLYRTLVNGFVEKYSHIDNEIYELIIQRKTEEARRRAHSIKGLAGNLGVEDLRKVALDLETDIKQYLDKEISDEDVERIIETTWYEFSIILGKLLPVLVVFIQALDEELLEAAQLNDISILMKDVQPLENSQEIVLSKINPDDTLKQLLKVLSTYNYELIEETLLGFDDDKMLHIMPMTWKYIKEAIANYEYDEAKDLIFKGTKDEN